MLACAQTAARTWIHKDDSEHGSDPESSRSILPKEWISADPNRSSRDDDDQAAGGGA